MTCLILDSEPVVLRFTDEGIDASVLALDLRGLLQVELRGLTAARSEGE